MTAAELIEALRALPADAPVVIEFTSEIDGSPYIIEVSTCRTREVARDVVGFEIPCDCNDKQLRVQAVEIL